MFVQFLLCIVSDDIVVLCVAFVLNMWFS